jgi:hypothetical protein
VGAGDFDEDGKYDLCVANFGSDNVSVLLNTTTLPEYLLTANAAGSGGGIVQSNVNRIAYSYPSNISGEATIDGEHPFY